MTHTERLAWKIIPGVGLVGAVLFPPVGPQDVLYALVLAVVWWAIVCDTNDKEKP